jgi:hypothetical protein
MSRRLGTWKKPSRDKVKMKKLIDTPDPILKQAMAEIQAIVKKYDLAANVILTSPDAMEHLLELEASWTCTRFEPDPTHPGRFGVRFKTTELPPGQKQKAIEDTVGTLMGFNDAMVKMIGMNHHLLSCVGRYVETMHVSQEIWPLKPEKDDGDAHDE